MPMPSKGRRMRLTVRVPYDEYREIVVRAKARRWTISDYCGWVLNKELKAGKQRYRAQGNTGMMPESTLAILREFPDELDVLDDEALDDAVSDG